MKSLEDFKKRIGRMVVAYTYDKKPVTVDDIKATDVLFDHLMGTAAAPRKKFIQEHSKEATYGI